MSYYCEHCLVPYLALGLGVVLRALETAVYRYAAVWVREFRAHAVMFVKV